MTVELREKISKYRISANILKEMLNAGVITEEDYSRIDTILAEKCGLDSSTIFR